MATVLSQKNLGLGLIARKVRITTADLVNASTSRTVALGGALPTGAEVIHCFVDLKTVFASGTITAVTVQVGTSADTNGLMAATELLSGPPAVGRKEVHGVGVSASGAVVNALFTATTANFGNGTVSALSAGVVECTLVYAVVK